MPLALITCPSRIVLQRGNQAELFAMPRPMPVRHGMPERIINYQ